MPNLKRYEVEYDWKGSLIVEINHDVMTDEKLHDINDFWSNNTYRISKQGSVLNAVLAMLAQTAFLIQISNDYNTYGVVSAFSWENGEGQEGWPPMDGSEGIKIIDCQIDLFDADDMTITAAK